MPYSMPEAVCVPDAPRRLSRRRAVLSDARSSPCAYCVGCCWALMVLLLAGDVMNVLWIGLLALLILLEKVAPFGRQIALVVGVVLIAAGMWLFSMGMS